MDPLQRALDLVEHAVDGSTEGEVAELNARYQKAGAELERAAVAFSSGATAAGESPPARFMATVRDYRQQGADLIELTTTRRKLIADYSSHFEQLNTRVKKSLDHAWKIFGRVVARQSLVKLTSDLDDLRRRYVEFVSADTVDSSTFDTLGASEGALAQTLTQDRAGNTRAEGQDWYTRSQADLQAMSDARRSLLKVDRARKDGARKFAEQAAALSSILSRMGKTETYVARHPVRPNPLRPDLLHPNRIAPAGSTRATAANVAGGADAANNTVGTSAATRAAAAGATASAADSAATPIVGEHTPPSPTDSAASGAESTASTTSTVDLETRHRKTLIA